MKKQISTALRSMLCGTVLLASVPVAKAQTSPPVNTDCSRSSAVYNSFFRHKESFIPFTNPSLITPATVYKKVKVRLVIEEPDFGDTVQRNFRQNDIPYLDSIMMYANNTMQYLQPANYPDTIGCGDTCFIQNERISFEVVDIIFTENIIANIPFTDSLLDIRFVVDLRDDKVWWTDSTKTVAHITQDASQDTLYVAGAFASGTILNHTTARFTHNNYITMHNQYICTNRYPHVFPGQGHTTAGGWWNEGMRLVHELHHQFNLMHLGGTQSVEPCDTTNIDYLTDVFRGYGKCLVDINMYDNILTYGYMAPAITPMQMGKAHRAMFMGSAKQYSYPVNAPHEHPWIINTSQTWDFAIRMFQDIRVPYGKTLTLKCEVQMPPGGRIVVEPGGKLIVDGGIITSYNSVSTWGGIEAKGGAGAGIPASQGTVEVKNGAIIEHTEFGVRNFSSENPALGKGFIKATNSYFYNSYRMVELKNQNSDYYAGTDSLVFDNCTFSIDNKAPFLRSGKTNPDLFVTDLVKAGIAVRGCTFINSTTYDTLPQIKRGRAMHIARSGIDIRGNAFQRFKGGINLQHIYPGINRKAYVTGNVFDFISDNITVAAYGNAIIKANIIKNMVNCVEYIPVSPQMGMLHFIPSVGVYLDRAHNTMVSCYNDIRGTYTGPSPSWWLDMEYISIGVIANNTRDMSISVAGNSFSKLYRGMQTQQSNNKLRVYCNTFHENLRAWYVNPQSTGAQYTLNNQGTGCTIYDRRANNAYSSNQQDIASYITNSWNYYAFGGSGSQYPSLSWGSGIAVYNCLTGEPSEPNSQCYTPNYCYDIGEEFELPVLFADHAAAVSDGDHLRAQVLFTHITDHFNSTSDYTGLKTFLENEGTDEARKMLIPLYIEIGDYTDALTAIAALTLSEPERTGYYDFYGIIADIAQEDRSMDSLTTPEQSIMEALAADSLEVSAYARSVLDLYYNQPWFHHREDTFAYTDTVYSDPDIFPAPTLAPDRTILYDASPNPASGNTLIRAYISREDAGSNPQLLIHGITGSLLYRYTLREGENRTEVNLQNLEQGLYIYRLSLNGQTINAKKISVVR